MDIASSPEAVVLNEERRARITECLNYRARTTSANLLRVHLAMQPMLPDASSPPAHPSSSMADKRRSWRGITME